MNPWQIPYDLFVASGVVGVFYFIVSDIRRHRRRCVRKVK